MQYKTLGKTGVQVSSLCFGTMTFGGDSDDKTSGEIFRHCRDFGINFFDCADVYRDGISEEILGKLIADCRDEVVLTSKVYFPTGKDVNAWGASRYHIMNAIEDSLRRLKTDRIDIYFIHRFDSLTPLEETLRALEDLRSQGKILYAGASNFAAWQIAKANGISRGHGWVQFDCIQPMYNLIKRQAEVEILPMALCEKIGVISYSPLGGGLLTGKYGRSNKPERGRLIENKMYQARYKDEWIYDAVDRFAALAKEIGHEPASLAVAWVASHPGITAPIIGARSLHQLESSLRSTEIEMTAELRERISSLTPEPPPATDRSDERTEHSFAVR